MSVDITHLEELYARRDLEQADYQQARDAVLTDEQRAAIAQLDSEHESTMEEINDAIKAAEEQVKAAVVEAGKTIKGARWQAVYSKPRVSWDDKRLEEYFKAHEPGALDRMRKISKPSVSIRKVTA
jgi:enoyl-CoA hydratase/carnithine racemase